MSAVRAPLHDRRIANGDDFAGDAWRDPHTGAITYTAIGHGPPDTQRYALIIREIPLGTGKPIRRTRILGARLSGFTAGDALHLLEVVRDLHAWRLSRGPLSYSVTAAMVPL
ncbi:MAG: hypothetical protein AB7Q01_16465 [Gammaproteobacteria bacterium]